ncbi:MAG TPA: FliH/SctL family protein [bacterium]|nr:FliH/SctL family protein [bacterium]
MAAAEARRVRYESALAEDLVSVAIHAAEHLICREIKEDPSIVLRRIEAGLVLLRRERGLKLHVNPDVAGRFSRDIQSIARKRSLDSSIEIIADESMGPGDCVLVSPDVRIDMTLVEGLRIIHRHFLNREFTERS